MRRLSERYSVVERIGRGGVGDVYKGWQEALDRPVAIKVLRPELTRSSVALRRFEREARTTCRLHHPNVVTVFDVGTAADGTRFLVMELLQGSSLARVLQERAPLPLEETLHIARQIVRGMGAGEGVGLVHRDLKPENIFLEAGNHVKILDFGLATLLDTREEDELDEETIESGSAPIVAPGVDSRDTFSLEPDLGEEDPSRAPALTNPQAVMGTPRYMPPEQVLNWAIDHRSDLYSFGCILFEMLVGKSPFTGPEAADYMRQHLHDSPPTVKAVRPEVPEGLSGIVERLLQKSPGARFQDWSSLSEALATEMVAADDRRTSGISYPSGEREPLPTEPYRFLRPFTAASQAIFFGRDKDTDRFRTAWDHVDRPRIVFLTGASGVGKTSFLAAKIVPALEALGHRVVQVRGGTDPLGYIRERLVREIDMANRERPPESGADPTDQASLCAILLHLVERQSRPIALVLDQIEELFTSGRPGDHEAFQAGIAALIGGTDHRIRVLLSVREDFLGALHRTLHPLPVDEISRTVPLRRLEADDLREALAGPGRASIAVRYKPFRYDPKVLDVIVGDLLADAAGEVAPRVQAVGARLWEMVKDDPDPVITETHYITRLGSAQGILARTLDEAVNDLGPADRDIAKELLWALTHLPGSPTSRPAAESELVARAVDSERRKAVLKRLEDRWRVVQGYTDPRWPDERCYRIAHESLIQRIQQYSQEGTERNRARQLFHHGLALWLQGGCRDSDVLSEEHFAEVQAHIEDLVLRTEEERSFYDRSFSLRAEGWSLRVQEERRRTTMQRIRFVLFPAALLVTGFVLGQAPIGFATLRALQLEAGARLGMAGMDFSASTFHGADFQELELLGIRFQGAWLDDVDFSRAELERASFRGASLRHVFFDGADLRGADFMGTSMSDVRFRKADLRHATLGLDLEGGDFTAALFDRQTLFGGAPPKGALGPGGDIAGMDFTALRLARFDLQGLQADGAVFTHGHFDSAYLEGASLRSARFDHAHLAGAELSATVLVDADLTSADLSGVRFVGSDLRRANLTDARLVDADLSRAQLDGARLCGADLTGARIDDATFVGATDCAGTRWPAGTPLGVARADVDVPDP